MKVLPPRSSGALLMLPQPRRRLFLRRAAKTFPYTRHDLGKQSYTDIVKRTSTGGHYQTHTDIVKAKNTVTFLLQVKKTRMKRPWRVFKTRKTYLRTSRHIFDLKIFFKNHKIIVDLTRQAQHPDCQPPSPQPSSTP